MSKVPMMPLYNFEIIPRTNTPREIHLCRGLDGPTLYGELIKTVAHTNFSQSCILETAFYLFGFQIALVRPNLEEDVSLIDTVEIFGTVSFLCQRCGRFFLNDSRSCPACDSESVWPIDDNRCAFEFRINDKTYLKTNLSNIPNYPLKNGKICLPDASEPGGFAGRPLRLEAKEQPQVWLRWPLRAPILSEDVGIIVILVGAPVKGD